ncbi:MAG: EAL domain-containing protein [Phycisphaeraceae bacterium]|nr:MAG: EAL domain-containing protein [Phycisphaeraceae bacterium]
MAGKCTTGRCDRCERVKGPGQADAGELHLWLPAPHALVKAIQAVRRCGHDFTADEESLSLKVVVTGENTPTLLDAIGESLTGQERRDARAILITPGVALSPKDFPRVTPFDDFSMSARSQWLVEMLSEERITHLFQPIVDANDTTNIFAHEALMRGVATDGSLVSPGEMLELARASDLLFPLDLMARRSAIRNAQKQGLSGGLFINFSPAAIYDPKFCLRTTVAAIREAGFCAEDVVFEVVESERCADMDHLKTILRYYREAGFHVALDDVGAGYSSLNMLHELQPDFVKLDMELTRNVHADKYKAVVASKILEIARDLGIRTVAEGVETPEELDWLQRAGATFVQGYLIGRPAERPMVQARSQAA